MLYTLSPLPTHIPISYYSNYLLFQEKGILKGSKTHTNGGGGKELKEGLVQVSNEDRRLTDKPSGVREKGIGDEIKNG